MLVGYARVSTHGQEFDLQKDALKEVGCERVYTDIASGAKMARPGLDEALEYLRAGDTLVVWRLDRLGRSLSHLIEVVRRLEDGGVGFRPLQEQVDTTTAGGKLVFHVFGALAEFERELIRERAAAGLGECQKVWGNQAASCSASTDLSPAFSPGYHCSNFPRSVPSRVRVRACSMR